MPDQGLQWVDATGGVTAIRGGVNIDLGPTIVGRYGPTMRFVTEQVPLQPGQRFRNVQHGLASVAVSVVFHPMSSTTLRPLIRQWAQLLDPRRGDGKLRATDPSGTARDLVCRYLSGLEVLQDDNFLDIGGLAQTVLHFAAEQPYWQDSSPTVQSWSLLSSLATFFPIFPLRLSGSEVFADATVDNSLGDVEAWPVWTITGPGSNPILRNLTTGMVLSLPVTLLSGESVVIDTRPGAKTVTKQDGTNLFGSLASPPQLWNLAQGSNSIRIEFTAATAGISAVTLTFRKQYLSA
jgi:Phage tail protein